MNDEPTTSPPTAVSRRLADFAPDGPAADTPAVTLIPSGPDVVVLRRDESGTVEVCQGHQILTLMPDVQATPITDPVRRDELVHRALRTLAVVRHTATHHLALARGERDGTQTEHQRVLRDIRRYAIDRHLDNEICRQGLDTFLEHFNLDPYQPRLQVRFRITGTVEVDTENQQSAEHQVQHYLGLDLSNVGHAIEDSEDIQVSVTGVEPIHD